LNVIARRTLRTYWEGHPDAEAQLKAWYVEAKHATWRIPQDIKKRYGSASFPGNNRVVFNICGNKYRLVVHIKYEFKTVYIRFIGTHAEYGRIDVKEI
jgi:mRNA interferase HigB